MHKIILLRYKVVAKVYILYDQSGGETINNYNKFVNI